MDSYLPLYTILYNNIGHSQLKTGNYTGALASYSKALEDLDNTIVKSDVLADQKTHLAQHICATLNCIAVVKYHEYSRSTDDSDVELLDEVGELLAEALAIRATSGDMKQVLSRDTATILNNMGRYNFEKEEFAEALEFYKEAYECRRIILGDNHSDVAATLFNIAQTHAELSNTTEAISSYKKFISIGILTLGENHLDISNVRFIVGQICHNNNDLEGAFEQLTLALKSSRTTVGGPDDETIALVSTSSAMYSTIRIIRKQPLTPMRKVSLWNGGSTQSIVNISL